MKGMTRESIAYTDEAQWLELRKADVTSTDCAALFGISPYSSRYELWHEKAGIFELPFIGNERTAWGNRLEASIALGAAEEHDWKVEEFKTYGRISDRRLGSSFDFRILEPSDDAGILEVKNLDFLQFQQGWMLDKYTLEAPPHIELQVQHQMLVADVENCHIAALVGGNQLKMIRRNADKEIQQAILTKTSEFWDSIEAKEPPPPHFPPDSEFVAKLYGFARTGTFEDRTNDGDLLDLIEKYRAAAKEKSTAEKQQKEYKARILMMIGDTEKVTANRFTISAGMVGPADVAYTRKPFRNFRITAKKE